MSPKRFLISTIAGAVTLFFLGFLFYGVLLKSFFASHMGSATGVMQEPPVFWALIVGELAMAALLTTIFGRWAGISTFASGIKAGAEIGLLMGVSVAFVMFAVTNISDLTAALADSVVTAIRLGLGGGVIGMVLGKVTD